MGKIISIASQKGGVGKTTTALNLGYCLTRFGSKVLLIDGDPQGGMSIASNLVEQTNLGLLNLIKNTASAKEIVLTTRDKTMGIVGLGRLQPDDVLLLENEGRTGNLGMLIQTLTEGYEYVIIDTPSGVGGLPASLLSISDSVIMVINCRAISLKTIPLFLKLVKTIQGEHNPKLQFDGVVIAMFNEKSAIEKQILQQIREAFPPDAFFKTLIPFDEYYETASLSSVPVALMPDGLKAGRPYFELAMEIREKESRKEKGGEADEHIMGLF